MLPFLETVPESSTDPEIHEMYQRDEERVGYLPNYTRAFSLNPAAYQGWRGLIGAIGRGMDSKRYELATVGAARRLRSSYCSLAHGSILVEDFYDAPTVQGLFEDPGSAPVDELDRAVLGLAGKVADDATSITEADIDQLRRHGLTDREILDVILAAAARCFFSKVLDATGTLADQEYADLEPGLLSALTVGRPITGR
jgi:uncharacterized peroxidase-related enzyme